MSTITLSSIQGSANSSENPSQVNMSIALGFQLIQEKLVRIMGNIQGMLMLAWRISVLYDTGKSDMAQIALAKAWITERAREVCRLGR